METIPNLTQKSESQHLGISKNLSHCSCITTTPETHCSSNRTHTSSKTSCSQSHTSQQSSYDKKTMRGSDTPQKEKAFIYIHSQLPFPPESTLLFPSLYIHNSVCFYTCAPFVPSARPLSSFLYLQRRAYKQALIAFQSWRLRQHQSSILKNSFFAEVASDNAIFLCATAPSSVPSGKLRY